MIILFFVGVAACSVYLISFLYKYVAWVSSPLWRSVPGPPRKSWLFGQFFTIMNQSFMKPHKEWIADAPPDTPMLHYSQLLGSHTFLLLDAELVKQVLHSPSHIPTPRFIKKFAILQRVLGKGLVMLEGPDWNRHRRILHPSFNERFLKQQLNRSVPGKVQKLVQFWRRAGVREINVAAHMSNLTLDVIGDIAFSHDFKGMDSIERWSEQESTDRLPELSDLLISSMNQVFRVSAYRVLLYVMKLSFLDRAGRRSDVAMNAAADQVIRRARALVQERSAASASTSRYEPKSILELLVDAKAGEDEKRSLSDVELRDEVKTFIVAGHETTSTWAYWALFALCQYPDVQQKVYEEVTEHANGDESMNLDVVEKMTYLDAFLKETLRFFPPVGMMFRFNTQEEALGGVQVPPDSRIIIPIHLLHRSPKYWDQPETFLPERWLSTGNAPYTHPMAFIPFSAGPRICIGYKFATMEAKLILAPLIRAFKFQLPDSLRDTKFELTTALTIKAKPDFKVLAVPRDES